MIVLSGTVGKRRMGQSKQLMGLNEKRAERDGVLKGNGGVGVRRLGLGSVPLLSVTRIENQRV